MGSNAINLVEEDLCCPVCKKPLSSPGNPPKPKLHKLGRGKGRAPHLHNTFQAQRDTRMAIGKFKDNEEIVIAQCGHLFHKFCLRHYCYLVREGRSNHMYKVSCPSCDRHISMSSQAVDYRVHQDKPNNRDKDFTKTSIMNNELSGQMSSVQQKWERLSAEIEDGNHNFDIYRSHWKKLRKELKNIKGKRHEIDGLYAEIERSEQMLKCMQSQQLKIVKKFIMKVKEKTPKDFIHFPRRLAPFLNVIEEDDRLVRDLGEIIVPIHLNHLKSDRQSLLKGIISTVREKLAAQGKSMEVPPTPPDNPLSRRIPPEHPKKPAIFVKVRKSSISIMSSASLTRESIQHIIETVDIPFHGKGKISAAAANKKKVNQDKKASSNQEDDDNASATDIKVLYMPRRKMAEQISEPCRSIEENESRAKVSPRKCKSTDAVLVKTKKKRETPKSSRIKSGNVTVEQKRSCSAAVMTVQSENVFETVPPPPLQYETCQKPISATANESDSGTNTKLSEQVTSPLVKVENTPRVPTPNQVSATVPPPPQTASVLKLIYDKLEEECKSTHKVESRNQEWTVNDENNNKLFPTIVGKGMWSTKNSGFVASDSQVLQPPPQFFRVDGRGIPRPESPSISARFREPTFLKATVNPFIDLQAMSSTLQPDEENQLDALSPEERFRILSEHEAFLNSRGKWGATARRPDFHGTPACLGLSKAQGNFGTPPDPYKVPFYLKKWQQQLTSRKTLKTVPKRFANDCIRSTRLVNSPKGDNTSSHVAYSRPQVNSSYQRQAAPEKISTRGGIHLPPLSMQPSKRPTTAQCDVESAGSQHLEGPERELSRIYNLESVWK